MINTGVTTTYTGGTILSPGTVTVPPISSTGADGAPTSGPFGTGTITFAGGSFRATTGANITIQNPLAFTVAGTSIAPGTVFPSSTNRDLTFTGPIALNTASASTVWVTFQTASNTATLSGIISDGANTVGLGFTSTNVESILLSGANTYKGGTTFNGAATYTLSNTSGSATGTGPVALNAGTLATVANSSIPGALTAGPGTTILPGGTGAFGTFTIGGNLSLSGTTALKFDETAQATAPSPIDDLIVVGGTLSVTSGQVPISITTTPTGPGLYRLISASNASTLSGSFTLLTAAPARTSYALHHRR